ncbi:MAG TPA: HEAT repeat domain-containing protein, partial [Polyangia bacterium]
AEAARAFAEALKVAPDSVAALVGRARALAGTGAVAEAVAAYDQALEHERRPPLRRRLIEAELALLAREPGADLEHRLALRRELVTLAPESDAEAGRLADLLESAGRPAEAAQTLERHLPADPAAGKLALALRAARLRLADGDPGDAARAAAGLAALIRQLPAGASESRRAVWTCARDLARSRGTLGALAEELEHAPGPVEWEVLGQVRDELGDLEGALAATRTALERAPRDAAIGRRLIALQERLGRDEEATATTAELARRLPSEVGFSTELANRQLRDGDRAAAAATLDRATIHFARQPAALRELAESAARAGDDRRALAIRERLAKLDPSSEIAIVGLGEAQFQSGKKDDARRTWSALRGHAGSAAAGHLRLGEVLFDHDLFTGAIDEAHSAQALEAKSAAPHRLLARIYERQRKPDAALDEWNRVLLIAGGAQTDGGDAGLRREARTHTLALLVRQGRGRLDAEVHRLRGEADAHPDDAETWLFLAEAQQRLGDGTGAMTTLRAILARASAAGGRGAAARADSTDPGNAAARAAAIEAGFALARLLERTGQLDEATARLEELGRLAPARAREAQLQVATIALGRYDTSGALARAAEAEVGADPAALARIAEIRERAGADTLAAATYRKALQGDAPPAAALSLARIQVRQGDGVGAATTIATLLRTSHDDASVTDAARRALTLDESLGRLPELAEMLSSTRPDEQETTARRKALVGVLERMLPPLYRDPTADATRARLGRRWLRPLLDLITDTDQAPDLVAIELLGMLGNTDAAPALARIATRVAGSNPRGTTANVANAGPEAQLAAIVALGRLADPRGRSALERAMGASGTATRTAAVWSLGRIPDSRVTPLLERALEDRRSEIQAAACLGLGRHAPGLEGLEGGEGRKGRDGGEGLEGGEGREVREGRNREDRPVRLLAQIAADPARPLLVRRAAIAGLGRAGLSAATGTLIDLLDAGDVELSRAAAFALARARDPRALPVLLTRALLPERFALADADAPIAALGAWLAAAPPPDEGRFINGNGFDLADALAAFTEAPAPGDLAPLWRGHTRALEDLLAESLAHDGDLRRAALAALDSRTDGPGLGALAPEAEGAPSPDTALALREIALPLADRIAALLDDPAVEIRAAALRVL